MKAFVISLSKIESSITTAIDVHKKLIEYGFDAELFEGTDGDEAVKRAADEGRTLHPTNHFDEPVLRTIRVAGPGAMGCFFSHYRLWEKCVELNESIFIFEDDVNFIRPYYPVEFNEVLITVLGSWHAVYKTDVNIITSPIPMAQEYLGPCIPGTPGYAISPIAAKKLLNVFRHTYTASDVAIRKSIVDIKIHSHLMGSAITAKQSLTNSDKMWNSKYV